jgi:hypothetical protein
MVECILATNCYSRSLAFLSESTKAPMSSFCVSLYEKKRQISNHALSYLKSVTLGDEEANRRGVQKTVLERKGPSTFTCAAEIVSKKELRVHRSLEATVDALLAGSH